MRSLSTITKSSPHSLQLKKSPSSNKDPVQPKKKKIHKNLKKKKERNLAIKKDCSIFNTSGHQILISQRSLWLLVLKDPRGSRLERRTVFVSQGGHKKYTQTTWLQTTEMYSHSSGAQMSKTKASGGPYPLLGSRTESFLFHLLWPPLL